MNMNSTSGSNSSLNSFNEGMRVAVIGSSGGIGSALVRFLEKCPAVDKIYSLCRIAGSDSSIPINFDDETTIAVAAESIRTNGPLDLVIVASGLLHYENKLFPEKTFRSLETNSLELLYKANTIGPALVAKHFIPLMTTEQKNVFAVLGARVGSIADNHLGGWYSYRMAKAALVMLIRTLAIETARRNKKSVCVALHPGTVDTNLSKPFQRSLTGNKLVDPSSAATNLLRVINSLEPEHSGHQLAWDGTVVPY